VSLPGATVGGGPPYDLAGTATAASGGTTAMIDGMQDLLADEGFRTGLRFGLLTVAVAVLARVVGRRGWPLAGLAFVVAGILALDDAFAVDKEVVVGLAVLAVGGFAAMRLHPLVWLAAAVPGAVLFARAADLDEPDWAFAVILVATLVGGLLVAEFDASFARTGLPPLMLAFTVLGAYVTVPETQHVIVLTGAALPLVVLGWPWPAASLGVGGSFAAVALVSWIVVMDGGTFRPSSVVGGLTSLGMFAVEPVVRRVLGRAETRHVVGVAGLHVVVVVACSRLAGLRSSAAVALAIAGVVYVAAGVALALLERRADTTGGGDGGSWGFPRSGSPRATPAGARGTSAFPHAG
jgi:hypothetical protein